ncbi:hypothetical protein [Streptomyces triculaminicus]|uniref:hypothetical protein n=1 Tax=Streptomyces triculaminicus TaxID=2816232 RepID=UPI0037B6FCD3
MAASPSPGAPGSSQEKKSAAPAAPLTRSALQPLLLTASDLGPGYVAQPADPATPSADDESSEARGCPALQAMDQQNITFPAQVEQAFSVQGNSRQQVDETLGSDTPAKLDTTLSKISQAYRSCQSFTVNGVTATINVIDPPALGDQRFGYLMTIAAPAGTTAIKALAIREGSVILMLSGDPAAVDSALPAAFDKLRSRASKTG